MDPVIEIVASDPTRNPRVDQLRAAADRRRLVRTARSRSAVRPWRRTSRPLDDRRRPHVLPGGTAIVEPA